MNSLIRVENISKRFGSVIANQNVSLEIKSGEVLSILGENGAGKSTLMNMLSGIYSPDSGIIYVENEKVQFKSPKDAIDMGIGMIHQHFKLVEVMSAKENIIAGQSGKLFVNGKKLSSEISEISKRFNLEIDPDKKVYEMSVAEKQRLEILKVLYRGARILILDEPTAVLTPQETTKLFDIIRNMKKQGCAVIIITHKLNEVMEISDRITVLRKGEVVGSVDKEHTNPKALTDLMVGRSVELSIERVSVDIKRKILSVEDVNAKDSQGADILKGVNFELFGGEILGVAGVAGSGQKELCEAIAGIYKISGGDIIYEDENIVGKSPKEIIRKGISLSFVPEDRLGMGLVGSMDMVDNILLKEYHRQKGFFVKRKSVGEKARQMIERLSISTPGISHPVRLLSGGNIQKVLLGREIDCNPHLMITAYPARGLDIGAAYNVYDLLNEQKKKGVGIMFVGEDLDVLLELCDRIMVMCGGKITGILDARKTNKEEVGMLMAGESIQKRGELNCSEL
ncbi:nucleoside ABC transporter ATP-binding protein [Peptoclostridium litorale DSM 5388]|uniref:ABC transporter n=1 Tax=Peptoclostridium litorale DSM 5388 TaxID=1121324 RepID=A0A069RCF1_PEPLI|nr:ABC transporter ATP-binding protein [Peptoclostridium litorale]KDR93930.1 ABC transporter [Peptoclostridium litorale DSM 5388]KDR95357.1 ABC transporter [Peptoclostridium litorale DSM 5388]SIN88801.1 nucleoside ABC transporter ATP-binding protein [Peptoclostridium litorale DSM 5388]